MRRGVVRGAMRFLGGSCSFFLKQSVVSVILREISQQKRFQLQYSWSMIWVPNLGFSATPVNIFQIRQWNLTNRHCIRAVQAHTGFVRGVSCSRDGQLLVSVGDDKTIKHWTTDALSDDRDTPVNTIVSKVNTACILILFETKCSWGYRVGS